MEQVDADAKSYEQGVRLMTDQAPEALRGFRMKPDPTLSKALAPPAFGQETEEPGALIGRFLGNNLRPGEQLGEYYAV